MMVAIGDSLSVIACSDDGEDWEDEKDGGAEPGKLSIDVERGWVMGTISKTVQHLMVRFRQKLMNLDELTRLGWVDTVV
jgi:hypothetical protein